MEHFTSLRAENRLFCNGGVINKLCTQLLLLAMLLLVPAKAMAGDLTARAEYDKTTKELRFVMDDQMPTNDENTLVVKLLDPETSPNWFDGKSSSFDWAKEISEKTTLIQIDKSFNGYALHDCSKMFCNFKSLLSINGSEYLNTANVTSMKSMFSGCTKLQAIDVSNFNTVNVTDMSSMFYFCNRLSEINLSNFNTVNVTNMAKMFWYCKKIQTIDVSNLNTVNVTDMSYMFYYCSSLQTLDVSNFNTANVTDMSYMFYYCSSLQTLDVSNFNTANVTDMSYMFYHCSSLQTLDVSNFNTANVVNMSDMFSGCSSIQTLDVSNFNTANVTDMSYMFCCKRIQTLDLSNFNTANVTYMNSMFSGCSSIQTLDLSNFNTANVTYMNSMFSGCSSLQTLNLSNFNTVNVINMSDMFSGCSSIQTLDLSYFNTANVGTMSEMFSNCTSLQTLDLSNFNIAKLSAVYYMFSNCSSLQTLDLSSFNTANLGDMYYMFNNCTLLEKIYVSSMFTTDAVPETDDIFLNCTKLPNYNGTTNKKYAHYGKGGYLLTYYNTGDGDKHELSGDELKTELLALDDSKYFVAHAPFTATTATYNRSLKSGTTWATLCLPFEVGLNDKNFRAYKVTSVSDDNVEFEEVQESITAGTPVLIKMDEGATSINIKESDRLIATTPNTNTSEDAQYQLVGLYTQNTFDKNSDNNCYIVKGNKLMNPAKMLEGTSTTAVASKAFRAYLKENTTSQAEAKMLNLEEQTTAIEKIANTLNDGAQYFDLQGRLFDAPQKGMNIVKHGSKTVKIMIR